ncbi:MAG: universal stress protein [Planctomycetota bacterium]
MKILLGHDGSHASDVVFGDLSLAGLPPSGQAIVVSVAEMWLPSPRSYGLMDRVVADQAGDGNQAAAALARRAGERVQKALPGWSVETVAYAGSAALSIIKKADEWRPDLIIVGSHGQSAVSRVLLGSVAQKIVTEARCSVRIARARRSGRTGSAVRLVVGVDGSPGSDATLRAIAARAWPKGSEAHIVTGTGPFTVVAPGSESLAQALISISPKERDEILAQTRQAQAAAEQTLRAAGLAVTKMVKEGDPKHLLLAEADAFAADCIFVGSTGLSRFERFLLGSVSAAVAPRAPCSVEVVRLAT